MNRDRGDTRGMLRALRKMLREWDEALGWKAANGQQRRSPASASGFRGRAQTAGL